MNATARLTALTRLGFAARGILYIVIAMLLLRAGQSEDPSGALDYLAKGGGRLLMIAIAAGFVAYGIWRLSDAIFNIEGHPAGKKGGRQRIGAAASGIVHLVLAWQSVRLIRGSGKAASGGAQEDAQAVLELPGGWIALVLTGLILIGVGAYQILKARKADFLDRLEPQVSHDPRVKWAGRIGYAARGLIFLVCGYFVAKAGVNGRAGEAAGMEEALSWLDRPWDMLVAIGLLAFGAYCLIEARYRIIHGVPVGAIARGRVRPQLH
ncbi:DUF1206 domain-containing protein [Sphingomonas xanthus]|uniref:DUF1206 domain-containing protein n=1 Tax=Sphingomonas xanthus TaxID=2594473 RepID=A0A516IRF2_9SPHN|nr:DUF1206 domain-containing protein [Sphingomonas xanthus]QDP19481.1 DUF1206 domain-containing protein [Sphingomonas xanthus]